MLKLWEEAGKSVITRLTTASEPALVFWVWAVTVWFFANGGLDAWGRTIKPLLADEGVPSLIAISLGALLLLISSAAVVDRLTMPVLRLLEGYWPRRLDRIADARRGHWSNQLAALEQEWATAEVARLRGGDSEDATTLARTTSRLSAQSRQYPAVEDLMPTRIGNIIRAGERRSMRWYSLDAAVLWPVLWLVLPAQARADVANARSSLDLSVSSFIWAAVSCLLGIVWWPAALVGVAVTLLIWGFWVPAAADSYAILVGAVFDAHRFEIYKTMRLPLPSTPSDEKGQGADLTKYLWNGAPMPEAFETQDGAEGKT